MPSAAAKAAMASRDDDDAANPLSGASVELLLGTAKDVVEKMVSETACFDQEREALFPHLDKEELRLGRVLGRGGFCVVNEIKKINLIDGTGASMDKQSERTKDEAYHRSYLHERCVRNGDARYAIKVLLPECSSDPGRYLKGSVDLAAEAKFLAVLEHPNIIKMRGLSSGGHFAEGNFLVLDRLYDTLEQRFRKWGKSFKKTKGVLGKITGAKKNKNKLIVERLHVAHDLAGALKYMHEQGIIYRDVKPENAGFDIRDDVKIFDFGLAKELNDENKDEDGMYKMTGFTGSLRYMAPEVAKSEPYNLSADVYSFGIIFWTMMELEPPFVTYSCKMHDELVVHKGYRPAVKKSWPKVCGELMRECWSASPKSRPNFQHVVDVLTEEAHRLSPDEDFNPDMDLSRRSHLLDKARQDNSART